MIPTMERSSIKVALPCIVTLTSMVLGLVSIVLSSRGYFEWAAWLIMYSAILDKADGSLARLLKAGSEFGMQMDSLSDFAAFGIAPGALTWFVIQSIDPSTTILVWAGFAAVSFPVAAALRLARFNVIDSEDTEFFRGVATTFAAGLYAALYLTFIDLGLAEGALKPTFDLGVKINLALVLPSVALALAALMLSNVRIPKLRFPKNKGKLVVSLVLMLVLLVLAVLRAFPQAHLLSGVGYLVIGAMIGAKSKSTN
ncbi:MAG: CDP-alcohol phosphatidyltransferase family protein [Myxococcota bacterium]|jgi:CDP-diacylglycerol--serine O-phosphatidyltransferase|nr:CDP-alcohol phosphatidyltransferase family protein [Myxococcota bacterium]HOE81574.1 CDP-alcohol phosphatidyltransferase family protein [Myxococcota bacterium]HON24644.1 CDP-alcohol phosphatidyltransferase family protein [Myxococcota bacterium]HOS62010.1 CDP-alcohol phosphatidyltransferase family protein [Myxococcota bacterium]HPC92160.1 CDP-alcohol phosphatidyltransferase family protein [Myxococcota bacterium]